MKIHQLDVSGAAATLRTALPRGLAQHEAERRLREFGPNRVERIGGAGWASRFLEGFTHFFALVLWVAALLAFAAESRAPGQGMAMLGAAIVGVILVNGLFSFWQERRAERALQALRRLLPQQVQVVRDGVTVELPAERLVPGDLVLFQAGNLVPADCRIVEAFGARVNSATVTGESAPQPRDAAPSPADDPMHATNVLLAGTSLVAGKGRAIVFATGMRTEFGRIAQLTQATDPAPSPLQREIVKLSRVIAAIAVAMGVAFYLAGQWLGLSFWANVLFAIGIIVANVPEGLLPTVTLALAMSGQRMARRGVLVRHLPSVEALGCATVICSDKTGTLTQNRMDLAQLFLGGQSLDPRHAAALAGAHAPFFEAALACHNLVPAADGALSGDPMEAALARLGAQALGRAPVFHHADELPFDGERRRMSTLHATPGGTVLYTKGALESLLPLCCDAVAQDAPEPPLSETVERRFRDAEQRMAQDGLRVIAIAYRPVPSGTAREHLEQDLTLLGLAGFRDPCRPEVPAAIRQCSEAGIRVIMVTGDHPDTALAIAREIGLVRGTSPLVMNGAQLQRLTEAELQLALDAPEALFARVGADQKLRLVQALQRKGHIVAATGDGVNDAPALRRADIGIAMGRSGADVAREAAGMVLTDDNFASLVDAVAEGRAVYDNIRKFLTYILTSNVPEIVPYLAFVLFRIPLPLTIIQILAVDLGTDMLPALALGAEPPEAGVMTRPPRPRTERLLSPGLLARAYLWLGAFEAAAAMGAFFHVLDRGGWRYGQALAAGDPIYLQATTACLSAIIVMQIVNVFLCRSRRASVTAPGAFDNRLLWPGIAAEIALILAIDYTPWGNRIFGTHPIGLDVWLYVLPFALAMLVLEEARKAAVLRWWQRR